MELDAWLTAPGGSSDNRFVVTAEVYVDGSGGRFSTAVPAHDPLDVIGGGGEGFSVGITVSEKRRTNLGCMNAAAGANRVDAEVFDASGRPVTTVSIALARSGWRQVALEVPMSLGYVRWRPSLAAVCYAVVVDNASNDGTLLPAGVP